MMLRSRCQPVSWFTLAVVLTLTSVAQVSAQQQKPPRVNVQGVLVDKSTGTPILGAYVGVAGGVSAVTDEQGRFMLRGVRAGTVMLEAGQLGYKDLKESREVVADGSPLRIEMEPDPIELKGIQVTSDRLRQRRNALAVSVRAYDATELATTPAFDALDFLRGRVMVGSCPRSSWSSTCVLRRGQWISPAVYVDDAPWGGGLDILIGWNPSDLYLIEVLASGSQIRLYTKGFAQRLALGRAPLQPVILW